MEPGAIPSPSLMEILGRDRIFLAKPLYINSQPRLPLLQGLAEGEAAEQRRNFSTHTTHKYLPEQQEQNSKLAANELILCLVQVSQVGKSQISAGR